VSLALCEQRERRDIQEDRGDREMDPDGPAAREGLVARGEDREQRRGAHDDAPERDLERRECLVAGLDEQERGSPEQREQDEPNRPGRAASHHGFAVYPAARRLTPLGLAG
jgi:hypothetical protein